MATSSRSASASTKRSAASCSEWRGRHALRHPGRGGRHRHRVGPPSAVEAALAATPILDAPIPPFLSIGFNRPVAATGAGIAVGDTRTVEFTGGSHDDHPLRLFGLTGERSVEHHSHMHLTVVASAPGRVVFSVDEDTTMLARWADLDRAVVTWQPAGPHATRVTWRLEYERLIAPAAYFGPLQRFGMGEVAEYLLDTVVERRVR